MWGLELIGSPSSRPVPHIVFEGLDSAGKGGTIRRFTERTNPRVFKHIALPAPNERQKSPMYVQRYISHFPAAGTPEQTEQFLEMVPAVEKAMVDSGTILIKYWLNVSVDEQARRLEDRIDDPRKTWKLSPTDLRSYSHRYDYCRARDRMLAATSNDSAPRWYSSALAQLPDRADPRDLLAWILRRRGRPTLEPY